MIKTKNIFIHFLFLAFMAPNISLAQQDGFFGMFNLNFGYGIEFPQGDLKDRFGRNLKISIGAENILENKYLYGVDFDYKFNGSVKEDVFAPYRLENGNLYGSFGNYSEVTPKERGIYLGAYVGKLFPISNESLNSIRASIGVGILQHYMEFIDDTQSFIIVNGDYSKGYDRLTRGIATKLTTGYSYFSKDRRLNANLLIEYTLGFTKAVRSHNFDTGQNDGNTRYDQLIGLKLEILLPFFKAPKEEIIYY